MEAVISRAIELIGEDVEIYRRSTETIDDTYGEVSESFTLVGTYKASFDNIPGGALEDANIMITGVDTRAYIVVDADVKKGDLLKRVLTGEVYEVLDTAITAVRGTAQYITLYLRRPSIDV